ncbi:testin isoform X3 [Nelusetta ayraudi]|uniref:testin isoform X3 n=1 Tax=Nelusetta ayraudi TaxID=303726 RepID=UPI003F703888
MEIEKEVKKMTLGHEFGAGAACLKCKDKCEGFELHFWRKICRNCKCGLTEHNVHMNSEEDKKVGKLFEDTKYTGLIAKLKKDGIPGYKGNAMTITLAGPATAHVVPPSASTAATVLPSAAAAGSVQPGRAAAGSPGARGAAAGSAAPGGPAARSPGAGGGAAGFAAPGGPAAGSVAPGGPAAGWPAPGGAQAQLSPAGVAAAGSSRAPPSSSAVAATVASLPKDVPVKSVTYEWAPRVPNQYLAVRYIQLLPPEKRPVAGTEGAAYRRQQMARQLPEHDQDPSKCHELSPAEVKKMEQFVRKYKDEVLGMGDVLLPEDMAQVQAGGKSGTGAAAGGAAGPGGAQAGGTRPAAGAGLASGPGGAGSGPAGGATGTPATAGAMNFPGAQPAGGQQQTFTCNHCQQPMARGEPAVYAERAGYDKLWHPACFVCCTCQELLVDMIYFWKKGKMYCGRHYGDSEKPRCGGCDELIFCNEYTQAEGQNWHLKHFCCFECDCVLAGETYVMEKDKPVCEPCYMRNYAVKCASCQKPLEPEAQRVSYGEHHWHAEPECFKCAGCAKCLIGQRFMAVQGALFCSVECKKKVAA